MKKLVYLHLGQHKTGSTSIQWAFTNSRDQLYRGGVLYPKTGAPEIARFGQHLFPWSVMKRPGYIPVFRDQKAVINPDQVEQLWQSLHEEINSSEASVVVLSSEEFDALDSSEIAEVGSRMDQYDLVPILYIRNFADLIESSYRTSVIYSNYSSDISDMLENSRIRFDLDDMIREWSSIAKDKKMFVLDYDNTDVRSDVLIPFAQICGIDPSMFGNREQNSRQNESTSAFVVEIVRFLRNKGVHEKDLSKWISQIDALPIDNSTKKAFTCLPGTLRNQFDDRYAEEVIRINTNHSNFLALPLTAAPSEENRVHVRNIAMALLCLGDGLNKAIKNSIEIPPVSPSIGSDSKKENNYVFRNKGYCPICNAPSEFKAYSMNFRSTYICTSCHSRPRHRALMHVINQYFPNWRDLTIHESSPSPKTASDILSRECTRYISSQFSSSIPYGIPHPTEGWRNENLEKQSFADESFDLVITQDVFEHIFRPDLAIAEIARTLKSGGAHICTVPLVRKLNGSQRRAKLDEAGSVSHLLTAQYHDNPIDSGGALVAIDWGYDIANYFDKYSNLNTTILQFENIDIGVRGELSEVLVSIKSPIAVI